MKYSELLTIKNDYSTKRLRSGIGWFAPSEFANHNSWNSKILVNPSDNFEVALTEPDVYDYCFLPHEPTGMVGRIIVAKATWPDAPPFDYFKSLSPMPEVNGFFRGQSD